jgi:hypothetical protein
MGMAHSPVKPFPAYERVRPVFRLFAEATGATVAHGSDEEKLARYYRERDALHLEVTTHSQKYSTSARSKDHP